MAVIWIDATSSYLVIQVYRLITRKVLPEYDDSAPPDAIVFAVQDQMRRWERKWLVVFR